MNTLPAVGPTSTLTTGMCLLAAYSSVGAIAALSTGLRISAWAPWVISVRTCVACLAASPFAGTGPISDAPYFFAYVFSYETYEPQKSVLARERDAELEAGGLLGVSSA